MCERVIKSMSLASNKAVRCIVDDDNDGEDDNDNDNENVGDVASRNKMRRKNVVRKK